MKLRFDHGTDGANISVANSAGGEDATSLTHILINNASVPGGNSNVIYSAEAAVDGPLGCRMFLAAAATYVRVDHTPTGTRWGQRASFDVPAGALTGTVDIMSVRHSAGFIASARLSTDKKPVIAVGSGPFEIAGSKPAAALAPGRYFFAYAFTLESAASAADATVEIQIIRASDNVVMHTWTSSAQSTGTAVPAQWRFGGSSTSTGLASVDIDSCEFGALPAGQFGRISALSSPPAISNMSDVAFHHVPFFVNVGPASVVVTPSTGVVIGDDYVLLPLNEEETSYTVAVTDDGIGQTTSRTFIVPAALASDWEILIREGSEWTLGTL